MVASEAKELKPKPKAKFYRSTWFIVLFLIVFFPVGLFFMWRFGNWSKKTKWIITVLASALIALSFIGAYNDKPSITINNSKDNKISTNNEEFEIAGKVSSIKAAKLTINDKPVVVSSDTKFAHKVALKQGDNSFTLVATNSNGEYKETLVIHRATDVELAAIEAAKKSEADKVAQQANADNEKRTKEKAEADAAAAAKAKADAEAKTQQQPVQAKTSQESFYINNVYYKGTDKYDIVVYSSSKDTLQLYVNDKNTAKTKVNNEGWATFRQVSLTGRAKLSFAKKVGWFKYSPVNYVKYISVSGPKVALMDIDALKALVKAEADATSAAKAKAEAEAQAQQRAYIDNLASTYCASHNGSRNIYVPQATTIEVWDSPKKDQVTKHPTQANCVAIVTFFAETIKSKYIENIVNAKVGTGMNKMEVLAAWGWPNNNSNFTTDLGSSGTWMWDMGTCYYGVCPHQQFATFYNGIVSSTGNY